jgi:hypothetical protein
MANDKIYPIDMNSKDILLQNEGGGGMIMNDQFIGIVGNMLPDQKKLLDDQEHNGGTNIQTDKFSSNIIITNASSNPIGVNDLASKNFDSLDQSIGTNQVVAPTPKDHCGGEGLLNYEWQETGKYFQLFDSLWWEWDSKVTKKEDTPFTFTPKNGVIPDKYKSSSSLKSEQYLKDLSFDQSIIDVIKSNINLDNSAFLIYTTVEHPKQESLSQSITRTYDQSYKHDEDFELGKIKDKNKYFKITNGTNKFEVRSVFDIQTFPSGLRSMVYFLSHAWGFDYWPEILLIVIGPDGLNILTGLGINKINKFDYDEIYKKFFEQYDDIINAYNQDKTKFLNTVVKVTKDKLNDQNKSQIKKKDNTQWYVDNIDIPMNFTTLDIGLSIALKYSDCPDEYELAGNVPPPPTPSVSVAATTTPTVAETNDDIYAAEFLPASEDEEFLVFDNFDYKDTCSDIIKNTPPPNNKLNNITAALPKEITKADLDAYVKFSDQAERDYNNGIINPNTIKDLVAIGKAANMKIYIGTARAGHDCETTSKNISRHMKGQGLDLKGFYDLSGVINGGKYTDDKDAYSPSTVSANFKAIADKFVATALTLPNSARAEGGNQRGVLWYFNEKKRGGNHFNHVHYSNSDPYPGWSPAAIPASFGCDCAKIRKNGLKALNCP